MRDTPRRSVHFQVLGSTLALLRGWWGHGWRYLHLADAFPAPLRPSSARAYRAMFSAPAARSAEGDAASHRHIGKDGSWSVRTIDQAPCSSLLVPQDRTRGATWSDRGRRRSHVRPRSVSRWRNDTGTGVASVSWVGREPSPFASMLLPALPVI